ncbi:MAG: membrane-bound PQQ-dependent dehydrogenase, glucose/quinate/shikimate family [Phenylobacterium sp.]|jgi:quinate dehydrogenase (quinone)
MADEAKVGWPARIGAWLGGGFIALVGAALLGGGGWLAIQGGSVYYLLAGAALLATGVLLIQRRFLAGFVYAGTLGATLIWGLWEAGFQFWPLLPRLFAPAVLGLFTMWVLLAAPKSKRRGQALGALAASSVILLAVLGAAVPGTFTWGQAKAPASLLPGAPAAEKTADWRFYGRDPGGARYSPLDQINLQTIKQLKVEWTFRTGEPKRRGNQDQNTPILAGDLLYVCTPTNVVIALEPETGREVWRHDPKVKPHFWHRCRGVGYWDGTQPTVALSATAKPATPAAKPAGPEPLCSRRILSTTINAELFALDAATGQRCPGFGKDGVVDLKVGVGEIKRAFYFQTSTPTVIGDRVIIGGWVADNQELGEPSGAVRAFDVRTGALAWAWDLGDPSITKLPPEGKTYTRGTPNVWSTPAFDPELGLVYLPTGNATPDYWGSHRSARSEAYSSSVVAVDAATGRERWKFQTVHHDVWDYDVPSQPMLIDFPLPGGTTAPGLVQLTKRGQIFVLDRRTGRPLTRVVESRVPGGAQPGEWLSTTQPYSVGMPTVGVERLTEKMMWGATPLDQLWCRIRFKSLRYDGDFTPPGSPKKPSLQHPGNPGGMNWGSGAYDPRRGLLIVSEVRMPQSVALIPTDKPGLSLARAQDRPPQSRKAVAYESDDNWLLSPLFAPCLQPPHGTLTAIDVRSREIVWQVPAGTAEAQAPLGLKSGLKIPIGTLGLGGPITTAGGLTFRAATTDPYLRAYDNGTGKVLWEHRLPVAASGTPMTFSSPKSGRQLVVLTAGGGTMSREAGDYVIAYALPR